MCDDEEDSTAAAFMMGVLVFFFVLVIMALYFYRFEEINDEEYREVKSWVDTCPELKPEIDNAMSDKKITNSEYSNIKDKFEKISKERLATSILYPQTQQAGK